MLKLHPSFIYLFVVLSGAATLSWESLWQIKSSLALGVSAEGTALTLAVTMGGMGLGSFLMGLLLKTKEPENPLRLYGFLECVIGVMGLLLGTAFRLAEDLDTYAYSIAPSITPLIHILGITGALSIPAICMGATFPVIGLISRQFQIPLVQLYGLNTLGGAAGILVTAFTIIPMLGVAHSGIFIALFNFLVAIATLLPVNTNIDSHHQSKQKTSKKSDFEYILACLARYTNAIFDRGRHAEYNPRPFSKTEKILVVCITGFAVFALEVAWFRSLTAAFQSTVYAFAVMLAAVLIALGQAAQIVKTVKKYKFSLGGMLALAGITTLLATPFIERFDLFISGGTYETALDPSVPGSMTMMLAAYPFLTFMCIIFMLFLMAYLAIGIPMIFLGMGFPWVIEEEKTPRQWGGLYTLNTLSAIAGSVIAAWVLLPWIGFVRTAWTIGAIIVVTGIVITHDQRRRVVWGLIGCCALAIAINQSSGVGALRTPGAQYYNEDTDIKVIEFYEGPSSSTSVVEYKNGERRLIIDGVSASAQAGKGKKLIVHYLEWMGSLPMIAHKQPKNALVICFGTGKTANAVRHEISETLDIVDIDKNVFKLAHNFPANESVLTDPRVRAIVMDGRAYMRRTKKSYDVITLEPMPPNMAGVNALYSREFYELAYNRLNDSGVIAQWLPYHSVNDYYAASIARTFTSVFPNSVLWVDPVDGEGILIGIKSDTIKAGESWPGFHRNVKRSLSFDQMKGAIKLKQNSLIKYGEGGAIITDDNQLLSYGENARMPYIVTNP